MNYVNNPIKVNIDCSLNEQANNTTSSFFEQTKTILLEF